MTYLARARPRVRTTSSNESTHSLVSSGSMSGSCVGQAVADDREALASSGHGDVLAFREVGRLVAACPQCLGRPGGRPR